MNVEEILEQIKTLQSELETEYQPLLEKRQTLVARIKLLKEGEFETINDAIIEQQQLKDDIEVFNEEQSIYNQKVMKFKELTKGLS